MRSRPTTSAAEIAITVADCLAGVRARPAAARAPDRGGPPERRAPSDGRRAGDERADAQRSPGASVSAIDLHPEGATLRRIVKALDDELQAFVGRLRGGRRTPKPERRLELLLGERQHTRSALDDRIAQAPCCDRKWSAKNRAVAIFASRNVLVAFGAASRACAASAARAICHPPQTIPISFRNGTAPACTAFTSVP